MLDLYLLSIIYSIWHFPLGVIFDSHFNLLSHVFVSNLTQLDARQRENMHQYNIYIQCIYILSKCWALK